MSIDIDQLVDAMQAAATGVLLSDVTTFRGFARRQLEAIALHTKWVGEGIATGEITEATRDFFLDSLEEMALNFARSLRGLLMVTIEKVWNAVVGVLWNAISTATNLVLPLPLIPHG